MCGICGIVNFKATNPVDGRLLEQMTSAQAHRGPDDHGYFIEENVGLGHRRLSIIDVSGGKQPIFNEDGSVVVVFNGEIYNFADLTGDLTSRGHSFTTRSDTETIVHAYEEYGENCMRDFRGMFAFSIWDRRRKRLFIVRDRLGIKPVYYYAGKEFFAFASEIKSLLQHPQVPREVDRESLDQYMTLRYVPGPRTMFKNIFKLQPGHWMMVENGKIRIQKYWDLEYPEAGDPHPPLRGDLSQWERDRTEEFEHLLEESVRLRLISEVPLGVFLSGGLDSSTMLAMMSRITGGERVKTFSVGFETDGPSGGEASAANEFKYAREAAAHFGAEHHEFQVSADQFREAIPTMVSHLDEPMADPTCIPLYFISRLAREHITVVLSGEGADETMGGYSLYQTAIALEKMRRRLGPVADAAPTLAALPIGDRARAHLRNLGDRLEDHYRGVGRAISLETKLALMGPQRFGQSQQELSEVFGRYFKRVEKASDLNRMLYVDAKVWLPEDLLLKADKMTMATAVELRVPFLDHKLVEFIATLPDSLKIRNGKGKWILRHCMGNVLPPSIIHRTKKGFSMPAESLLRAELKDFVHDALLSRDSACRKFFNPQAVEDTVARQEQGKLSGYQTVWSLLVFELWHKQFIEDFVPAHVFPEDAVEVDVFSGRGA
jgi:asparagine synthase (glutamine-hydrolysing)